MIDFDPATERTIAPDGQYPGAVQIVRGDGRCFQINGISRSARRKLERFASATIEGTPLPRFGRRWPELEP